MDHKSATFYKRSADGMFNSILSCHGVDSLPPILCNPLLCHPMQSWKQIPSPPPSLKVVLATSKIVFPLLFLLLFNLGIFSSVYGRGLLLNSISIMISPYMYMTSKGKGVLLPLTFILYKNKTLWELHILGYIRTFVKYE